MINKMAEEDVKDFAGRGVTLTPNEIVILHTLATAVTRSREVGNTFAAPRIADVGNTTLYEPTVAAELWVQEYPAVWWVDDDLMTQGALLWASAHALQPAAFEAVEERKARKAITKWLKARDATTTQLLVALVYVMRGVTLDTPPELEDIISAKPQGKHGEASDSGDDRFPDLGTMVGERTSQTLSMVHDVIAASNLTMDAIRKMPRRQLVDIYVRAMRYRIAATGMATPTVPVSTGEFIRYRKYLEWLERKYFVGTESNTESNNG